MSLRVNEYTEACVAAMVAARSLGVYAILRIQDRRDRAVGATNGHTDLMSVENSSGAGVQVFTPEGHSGFSSSDDTTCASLVRLVESAAALARGSGEYGAEPSTEIQRASPLIREVEAKVRVGYDDISAQEEEELVRGVCGSAMKIDPRLAVNTSYRITDEQWRIVRTDGTDAMFSMPRATIMNRITARDRGVAASVNAALSGADASIIAYPDGWSRLQKRTARAARTALELLQAPRVGAGSYRIVIDYALAKGLAHEAFGHAAETDGMSTSILGREGKFRVGDRVASERVSIVDGPLEGDYAYQPISANGIVRKTVDIVKDGRLSLALGDVFSAARAGVPVTGAGRAGSFRDVPIPRMTNIRITVDDPIPLDLQFEDVTPEDVRRALLRAGLLGSDPGGCAPVLYLSGYKGGQVNPSKGDFVFNCSAIYELSAEGIRLFQPAIFSGKVLSALSSITAGIGGLMTDAQGTCGKNGQSVPSSGGGNMFLVIDRNDEITIGGV